MLPGFRSGSCTLIVAALVFQHQKRQYRCCGVFAATPQRLLGCQMMALLGSMSPLREVRTSGSFTTTTLLRRNYCPAVLPIAFKQSSSMVLLQPRRRSSFLTTTSLQESSSSSSSSSAPRSSGADDGTRSNARIEDPTASSSVWDEYTNCHNIRDQVVSAISGDGGIKVTAVTARNLLNDVMMLQSLSAVSADALGRTMLCSILLSNGIPDNQTLQISMQTTGPIRGVLATCNGLAHVRGYVGTPRLASASSSQDGFTLQDAIGKQSVLQIVKNHPKWKRPYNGYTIARYGDVDRDVGIYLAESEQRSCALAAGLDFDDHQLVCTAAGGYLVEQLPDVTDHEISTVERNLATLVQRDGGTTLPTNLLAQGCAPLDLIQIILQDLNMKPLQQITPIYKCECSPERLVRSLRLLPRPEVDDILVKQEQIEARCEFCGKVYRMGPTEVKEKLEQPDVPSSSD